MSSVDQITNDIVHQLRQLSELSKLDASVAKVVSQTLGSIKAELSVAQQNTARVHFWSSLSLINHDIEAIQDAEERTEWLESIAASVRELLKADVVTIYEAFKQGQIFMPNPAVVGELQHPEEIAHDDAPSEILRKLVRNNQPTYIVESAQEKELTHRRPGDVKNKNRLRFAVREGIRSTAILPLLAEQDLIGLVFVNFRASQTFHEQQRHEIEEISSLAAVALNNLRLIRRQKRNADDLSETLDLIRQITSLNFDRQQILSAIIERMVESIGVPRGALVLWKNGTGTVVAEHQDDLSIPTFLGREITNNSTIEAKIHRGETVVIEDIAADTTMSDDERHLFTNEGIKSTLIVPAFIGEEMVASIGIDETRDTRHFTEREVSLCKTLANYTALAIDLADRIQQAELLEELRAIQQDVLQTTKTSDEAIFKILEHASKLLNCQWAELYAVRGNKLIKQASTKQAGRLNEIDIDSCVSGLAVIEKRPVIANDITVEEPFVHLYQDSTDAEMRSEMVVPLIQNDRVTYVFNVESPEVGAFGDYAEKALTLLAQQSATTLQLAERTSQQLALIDVQRQVLGNPGEFDDMLQTILDTTVDLVDAEIGQILLYHDDDLVIRASSEGDNGRRVPIHKSITGLAFQRGETINVFDLQNQPEFEDIYQWYIGESTSRSELAAPLLLDGRSIGVINVESSIPNAFSQDSENTIKTLANQAVMAINLVQNVTLDVASRDILRKLLSAEFDLYEVEQAILQTGIDLLEADSASLLTLRGDLLQVDMALPEGVQEKEFEIGHYHPVNQCISGLAVLSGELVNVKDVSQEHADIYQPLGNQMRSDIVVPLSIEGEVYGVLNFESRRPNAFSGYHENVLRELALTAAIAIQRTQILVRNKARGDILQDLLRKDIDLDAIQNAILEAGLEQLGADTTALFELRGDELQTVLAKAKSAEDKTLLKEERYKIDACLSGLAVIHGRVVNARDVKQPPYNAVYQELAAGMRSDIVAPIKIDDGIYGVINLESRKIGAFTNYHETILQELAATAALAIRTTLAKDAERAKAQIMENLLSPNFDLDTTQRAILDTGLAQLNADSASLLTLHGDELQSRYVRPEPRKERDRLRIYPISECISGLAVQRRAVVNVSNVLDERYKDIYKPLEEKMRSDIVAPIIVGDQVFGVINLESQRPNAFSIQHETILQDLASTAGVAIQKALLQQEANRLEAETIQNRFSAEIIHRLNNPLGAVRQWTLFAKEEATSLTSATQTINQSVEQIKSNSASSKQQLEQIMEAVGILSAADSELHEALDEIQTNTERAITLISKLRESARNSQTKMVNVEQSLQTTIKFCLEKFENDPRYQVELRLGTQNTMVRANDKLARVFEDLITNGIEAMENGGNITITTAYQAQSIVVSIQDQGKGIPQQEIPYLFEEWYTHKERDIDGHGIGLWLTKNYLDTYHGTIDVNSTVGVGTEIIVILPIAKGNLSNPNILRNLF